MLVTTQIEDMTLTATTERETRKLRTRTFWRRALRFVGTMAGVTLTSYVLGYSVGAGVREAMMALPETILGAGVVALVAGWVPVGFYYEGHRFRWVYIVLYYLVALLAAYFIGYAVGSAR